MRLDAQQARTGRLFKQRRVVQGKDWMYIHICICTYICLYTNFISKVTQKVISPSPVCKDRAKIDVTPPFWKHPIKQHLLEAALKVLGSGLGKRCWFLNVTVVKTCLSNSCASGHGEVACIVENGELFCCLYQMFCFGILMFKKCQLKILGC